MAIPGPFDWTNKLNLSPQPFGKDDMKKFTAAVDVAPTMGIALVDVSTLLTFASNFTKTGFAASLVKIAPMYAAFYLQDRLIAAAPALGLSDLDQIEKILKVDWRPDLKSTLPRSVGDFPVLSKIFKQGKFEFNDTFKNDMDLMIKQSDGEATARCIHKIGFDYMNGALTYSGLYSAKDKSGMWLAGDYIPDEKRKDNRDGVQAPGISTTQAASAQAVAHFLVNLAKGDLISKTASQGMIDVMTNTISWVKDSLEKTNPGMQLHGKIGYHGGTTHYCGIVKHGSAHYVFVTLFGWKWSIEELVVELDAVAQRQFTTPKVTNPVRAVIH
jgi:hypothetical protein